MAETAVLTLTEFLCARIAEDQAEASHWKAQHDKWRADGGAFAVFLAGQPERVLAECEARRQIVEYTEALASCALHDMSRVEACVECSLAQKIELYDHQILGRLALPYADHPDYREDWKP